MHAAALLPSEDARLYSQQYNYAVYGQAFYSKPFTYLSALTPAAPLDKVVADVTKPVLPLRSPVRRHQHLCDGNPSADMNQVISCGFCFKSLRGAEGIHADSEAGIGAARIGRTCEWLCRQRGPPRRLEATHLRPRHASRLHFDFWGTKRNQIARNQANLPSGPHRFAVKDTALPMASRRLVGIALAPVFACPRLEAPRPTSPTPHVGIVHNFILVFFSRVS